MASLSPDQSKSLAAPRRSHLAVASAVFGVAGFLTLIVVGGLFVAAAGVVTGHLAQFQIRQSRGEMSGRKLAHFGLWVSYLAMFLFPLVLLGAVFSLPVSQQVRKAKIAARVEVSQDHAARLFVACEQFALAHQGRYPKSWDDLAGRFLPRKELDKLLRSPHPRGAYPAFELVPHERPVLPEIASSVVLIRERAPARVANVVVVNANGDVVLIRNPSR